MSALTTYIPRGPEGLAPVSAAREAVSLTDDRGIVDVLTETEHRRSVMRVTRRKGETARTFSGRLATVARLIREQDSQ